MPEKKLPPIGRTEHDRGNMGPVSLSGSALGLRHVHTGLPVSPVERGESDCGWAVDPSLYPGDSSGIWYRSEDSLRESGESSAVVVGGCGVDGWRDEGRRAGAADPVALSLHVDRLPRLPRVL